MEKLDKVAKTLSGKIKSFAKLFGIFLGWCIFNLIVSLFVHRTRSLSLDAYRMFAEGLRNLATQDVFFLVTLLFDNKLGCIISIAMIIGFGGWFFVRFLSLDNESIAGDGAVKHTDSASYCICNAAYVVSYKQQVAFLA